MIVLLASRKPEPGEPPYDPNWFGIYGIFPTLEAAKTSAKLLNKNNGFREIKFCELVEVKP